MHTKGVGYLNTYITDQENVLHISTAKRIRIGITSGLVGGSAIFFAIFIIDFHLGQVPGTFYKTVGFPIGLEGISATLFGLISHMITAALIGAVFCFCSGLHPKLELSNINKGTFAGGTTGIVVYLCFFIPITLLVIQPLIEQGTQNELGLIATVSNIESVHLIQNMNLIVLGALIIHLLFGVIMGFTATLSMDQETKKPSFFKGKTMTTLTLVIIAGTISMGMFYGIIADYTPDMQQNELTEELSKIETNLTYSEFIDMSESERLAIITQMSTYSKELTLDEAEKFDKTIDDDMSDIIHNIESPNDLKFLQSAQISGVKGNDAHGKALIVSNGQETYLRLEEFALIPGIDQHIYLTKFGDVVNGIDIGKLKANKGNQNYLIQGIDSSEYNQMIVYSKPFDTYYASAKFAKIGSN